MLESLQHMQSNSFVTSGLQMNTVEKLTFFESYIDVMVPSKTVQMFYTFAMITVYL